MNHKSFPQDIYTAEINRLNGQLLLLKKRKDIISWTRLAAILLLIAVIYYLHAVSLPAVIIIGLVLLVVFIRLVILATNTSAAIENFKRLVSINENELKIAGGQYLDMPDGSHFLSPLHAYTNDLDIFGKASLYQYTNRTFSEQGNEIYAGWLLQPSTPTDILQKQEAIKELAPQYQWRQQLQADGMEEMITNTTENKVSKWMEEPDSFSNKLFWKILRWMYPLAALTTLALFIDGIIPDKLFFLLYILFVAVSGYITKLIAAQYMQLNKIVPQVSVLSKTAAWIEHISFRSVYLQQLQQQFKTGNTASSVSIKRLKKILDQFDYNLNMIFLAVINPFLLWLLQLMFELEKWRAANKNNSQHWFKALGEAEAISTLANIHFNHPQWVFPIIDEQEHGTMEATALGHPLIAEDKCIVNDFSTRGTAQVALITGSNMAGKSTFLRSIGVNTVLAMMGAPACAKKLTMSPMRIISSMRVADNLAESTSTFYAELKKLKSIIDCVNNHEKVFVLLDEILRGTNSLDRHTGSKALIKQLINKNAVAMLATHDVELAQLQTEYPAHIHNYHFDAQIANEELHFDYKLKEGICQSLNASILMKKIGIEL